LISESRSETSCWVITAPLFWATLLVVAGALIGNYFAIMGVIDQGWFWFGNQGLSYIQLGRFWQIGFFIGLVLRSVLVMRVLWPTQSLRWTAGDSSGPGASGWNI
jgi:nitric oxide reductase subunit B